MSAQRSISVAFAVAFAVVASGAAAAPRATPQAACGKVLPPSEGVYFGVMPGWTTAPETADDIVTPFDVPAFEQLIGRKVAFVPFSVSWHDGLRFPTWEVEQLWRQGYIPQVRLVNWPAEDYSAFPQPTPPGPTPSSAIAAGLHDAELRSFADAARATDIPIEFDFDAEMTAAHPWGGRFDGGGATTGYGDPAWPDGPEHFRDAYRRIVTIFREEGATNVTFIFHVNSVDGYAPGSYWEPWERFQWYYPGDDYIDWLGVSVYSDPLFGTGPNLSFESRLAVGSTPGYEGTYAELTALGSKPLVVNELGLYRMPSEQSKAQWVGDASVALQSGRYPRIKAIDWWAPNGGAYNGYPNSSPTFLAGFKAAFDQSFFDARGQFSGDCRPLAPTRITLRSGTLRWTAVPNAATYEVWRGSKRVGRTTSTTLAVARKPGAYRVRGANIVGFGPFATSR